MQNEKAGNKEGWEARVVLICPSTPVARRGTLQAPGQSLWLSLKVPLIPLLRSKEMQKCAYACGPILGELLLELYVSKGSMLIETCAHCLSATLSLTYATLYIVHPQ